MKPILTEAEFRVVVSYDEKPTDAEVLQALLDSDDEDLLLAWLKPEKPST